MHACMHEAWEVVVWPMTPVAAHKPALPPVGMAGEGGQAWRAGGECPAGPAGAWWLLLAATRHGLCSVVCVLASKAPHSLCKLACHCQASVQVQVGTALQHSNECRLLTQSHLTTVNRSRAAGLSRM